MSKNIDKTPAPGKNQNKTESDTKVERTASVLNSCENGLNVFEEAPPSLERAAQTPTTNPMKAFYSLQASEKSIAELTVAEKEKLWREYCEQCKSLPNKANRLMKEDLGELISDKECFYDKNAIRWMVPLGALAVTPAFTAVQSLRKKLPLSKGWSGIRGLAASTAAFVALGTWKHIRSDQVYHNEEKKVFTYRCKPLLGDTHYTVVQEGSVRKLGEGFIHWLKEKVNSLPDGYMVPVIRRDQFPPIIISGHNMADATKEKIYAKPPNLLDLPPAMPSESEV